MRVLLALVVLLIAGCSTEPTPLARVLDEPQAWNGKEVHVCGFLVDSLENCALWSSAPPAPDPVTGGFTIPPQAWLSVVDQTCMPGNPRPLSDPGRRGWASVRGVFRTGKRFGHLDQFEHEIEGAKVTPLAAPCDPGPAPNNSSKPTPLRGAA
ncbi:hypothetical protein GCM10027188_29070 [Lysobacter humi (ex Lee et al. 2017)]